MIPSRKKTPEEIAALRQELGMPDEFSQKQIPASPQHPASPASITPPEPEESRKPKKVTHSLRKHELPLAPAPKTTHKTSLPEKRHDPRDLAQIQKREALAKLNQPTVDPVAQLRKTTAHPILLTFTYLLSANAGFLAFRGAQYIAPLLILGSCALLTLFIFIRKKRSRHHAAILCMIILMMLVFGGMRYAPLLNYGS